MNVLKLSSRAINIGILAFGLVLLVGTFTTATAAQKAITVSSLKSACADKVAALDAKIAKHNKDIASQPKPKHRKGEPLSVTFGDNYLEHTPLVTGANKGIAKAEEDKKIVLVACELLEGALK